MHKLYLDMDGVLADFNRGVVELCHMKPVDQGHSTKEETDALWDAVRKVPHFYYQLKPIPGSVEMVKQLRQTYGDKVEILTGIPKPKRRIEHAAEDKIQWTHDILSSDIKVNIVYREEKPKYCTGKEDILIDDYEKNIREWQKQGGTGILFQNVDDLMKQLFQL